MIEEWREDLSYDKMSKLLTQVTGNEVLSSSGVQSYMECKAARISEDWVLNSNTLVKEIAVVSDILVYDQKDNYLVS